jgi:hypothetical protein
MKSINLRAVVFGLFLATALMLSGARTAHAHCDTMSGPVVTAARNALDSGDVNLVLIWVQPGDEAAIREEFARARAARTAGGTAQEATDRRFFEALVRIHRAGEGAPYTGIKPGGTDVGPAVAAADRSLAAGSVDDVRAVLTDAVRTGIERHFREVMERKTFDPNDVAAGRAFVKAYVEYTHFAEGLYDRATAATAHHEHAAEAHAARHETHGAATDAGAHAAHATHANHLPWILVVVLGLALVAETGWTVRSRRRG